MGLCAPPFLHVCVCCCISGFGATVKLQARHSRVKTPQVLVNSMRTDFRSDRTTRHVSEMRFSRLLTETSIQSRLHAPREGQGVPLAAASFPSSVVPKPRQRAIPPRAFPRHCQGILHSAKHYRAGGAYCSGHQNEERHCVQLVGVK